jgi:hypothetical protein
VADNDQPVMLTKGSVDLIGRVLKEFRGSGVGELPLARRRRGFGEGGGGSTTTVSIKIVLVDEDIDGVDEADPAVTFTADDVTLTDDETTAGYTVVLQDPVPDDDTDYDANHVDKLDLRAYRRQRAHAQVLQGPLAGQ